MDVAWGVLELKQAIMFVPFHNVVGSEVEAAPTADCMFSVSSSGRHMHM